MKLYKWQGCGMSNGRVLGLPAVAAALQLRHSFIHMSRSSNAIEELHS